MATSNKHTDAEVNELEFDWITLRSDMDRISNTESARDKMVRKMKENPWVPVGCLTTATVLTIGLWSFRTGRRELSQKMMRARVLAQGMTVASLIIGIIFGSSAVAKPAPVSDQK